MSCYRLKYFPDIMKEYEFLEHPIYYIKNEYYILASEHKKIKNIEIIDSFHNYYKIKIKKEILTEIPPEYKSIEFIELFYLINNVRSLYRENNINFYIIIKPLYTLNNKIIEVYGVTIEYYLNKAIIRFKKKEVTISVHIMFYTISLILENSNTSIKRIEINKSITDIENVLKVCILNDMAEDNEIIIHFSHNIEKYSNMILNIRDNKSV